MENPKRRIVKHEKIGRSAHVVKPGIRLEKRRRDLRMAIRTEPKAGGR